MIFDDLEYEYSRRRMEAEVSELTGESEAVSGDDANVGSVFDSARVLIGMASLVLTVLTLVLWLVVSRERDGLLLLVTIFAAVFGWAIGMYRRSFWSA